METQRRISNYVLKVIFEVLSSAIVIIDSSDGIDEEDEILRDILDSHLPAHTKMSTPTMSVSMPPIKATVAMMKNA